MKAMNLIPRPEFDKLAFALAAVVLYYLINIYVK